MRCIPVDFFPDAEEGRGESPNGNVFLMQNVRCHAYRRRLAIRTRNADDREVPRGETVPGGGQERAEPVVSEPQRISIADQAFEYVQHVAQG